MRLILARRYRHHRDFDATVGLATFGRVVVGDRASLAHAYRDQALAHDTVRPEVVGNRRGTPLGQALVVLVRTRAVRVTGNLDDGLLILVEDLGNRTQHIKECRTQVDDAKAELNKQLEDLKKDLEAKGKKLAEKIEEKLLP